MLKLYSFYITGISHRFHEEVCSNVGVSTIFIDIGCVDFVVAGGGGENDSDLSVTCSYLHLSLTAM